MTYEIENIVKRTIPSFNKNQKQLLKNLAKKFPHQKKNIGYDYKRQLDLNFRNFMENEKNKELAVKKIATEKYIKKKQTIIANEFFIRSSDIEKFFENFFFNELFNDINKKNLEKKISNHIESFFDKDKRKFNFLKNQLKKNISLFSPFMLNGGNNQNFSLLEIGVNSSNQGDGAEHIFVAKAMIAGFNASKVDVGSSGYDAIIEGKSGNLLKVQVKGFTNDNFHRRGRDRGGEGIDASNRSNAGRLVTSENCDVFVAVNKKNSELFIFSKHEIDKLPEKNIKRYDYIENWENWSKINQ